MKNRTKQFELIASMLEVQVSLPSTSLKIKDVLASLRRCPFNQAEKTSRSLGAIKSILPTSTKALGANFLKDVSAIDHPRLLVLTGQLYLDHCLERAIDRSQIVVSAKARQSFHGKMSALTAAGVFDGETKRRLESVNRLRNRYVHDLTYDLSEWDPSEIDWIESAAIRRSQIRKYRYWMNILIFRVVMMAILFDMHERFRWLHLENASASSGR